MKKEVKIVDGTPEKRIFWSIISDYNLMTSVCELIDNALDIWLKGGKSDSLTVKLVLDCDRQLIRIQDTAGGVPEGEHRVLVSPGATLNSPYDNIIGLFGVGSKRAVVALAEETKIITRHKDGPTYEIDINQDWLGSDEWDLPVYEVDEIPENNTIVDLSKLRTPLSPQDVEALELYLGETYAFFLKLPNFEIEINGQPVQPIEFDKWAYPPDFEPGCYIFNIPTSDDEEVGVEVCAGLIREKESGMDDYGVYFYCNERLIAKEVKDKEVGYITKLAGIPHSDASLARIIVKIYGSARLMPWNSSKSAVSFSHHVFKALQSFLIPVVSDYSSLSRRFKGKWEEEVFAYPSGEMRYEDINDIGRARSSGLPALPRVRKNFAEKLKATNSLLLNQKPWTLGMIEGIAAVDVIRKQRFETGNRIALILLDSTFEIALKEYIVHTDNLNLRGRSLTQIFENRDEAISVVGQKVDLGEDNLRKISHYYMMRNKLIHERATVDVTGADISNYGETVRDSLMVLFDLEF